MMPAGRSSRVARLVSGLRRMAAASLRKAARGALCAASAGLRPDIAPALAGAIVFCGFFIAVDPLPRQTRPYSSALYAAGGELLGASVSEDGQWRLAPSGPAPRRFITALQMFEDHRFEGHAGFDTLAVARAAWSNVSSGRIVSGASTITMQLARMARGPAPRSWASKLLELWIAVRLELGHTKAEIVGMHAATAPFGGNVVGLEAASFRWFGRPPDTLTWAEAASLATLPNAPSLVHPGRSRDELRRRRDALLGKLLASGFLDRDEYGAAVAEGLPGLPTPMPDEAPWLMASAGSGRVATTIDRALQKRVSAIASRHGRRLETVGIGSLAVVVVRVADGSIAAYIGNVPTPISGGDAEQRNWVDCAVAPRSSGSILKPFLYAAMVDSGELTPSRLVPDIPTRVGSYSPENNLKTYAGAVRADVALARSLNVPFVRLLREFGVERFAALLERIGFSTLIRAPADYGLTLILGGAEVTLIDAASAYAALARMAIDIEADGLSDHAVNEPFIGAFWRADADGGTRPYDPPFSPGAAWLTLEAMVDVARPGEEASWQEYASSRRVAWKTGTSFGSRDAWAVGISRDHVVAVWAGNSDGTGRPELKGSQAVAPLLFDVFENLPRSTWFDEPSGGLRYETVCADSGYAAGPDCAKVERVPVPSGSKTDKTCPYCVIVHLSEDGRFRVRAETAGTLGLRTERRFVLPPAIEWYYTRSTIGYRPLPPWAPGASGTSAGDIEFIAPEQGSAILVPIELDGSPGKTVFRVASRNAGSRLFWHLDGDYLGETVDDHRIEARPAPGRHELVVVSESGASATRRFEVYPRR